MSEVPEGVLSAEECLAWCDRYQSVPWKEMALTTTVDGTAPPMQVFASLAWHVRAARLSVSPAAKEER